MNRVIQLGGRSDTTSPTIPYDQWLDPWEHSIAYNVRPSRRFRSLAEEVDAHIRWSRQVAKEEHKERQKKLSWARRVEPAPHPRQVTLQRPWRAAMMSWRVQEARLRKGSRQTSALVTRSS